jgi:hypothetical protein
VKPRKNHPFSDRVHDRFFAFQNQFVRIAGEPVGGEVENDRDQNRVDHLWITVRAGDFGLLQITVNTCSLPNRDAGFDPRVRLGIIPSTAQSKPPPGVFLSDPLDYAIIVAEKPIVFHAWERTAVESILLEKIKRAHFLEGWGEFYTRGHSGIHQVHSRRASSVFPTDHIGRDGAIRFYFGDEQTEMVLFKFFGQL